MTPVRVVIPVRAFADGKSRLSRRFDGPTRARMMQAMADRVMDAAAPYPVAVVSSDPAVVAWAGRRGAEVLPDPASLDQAAAIGREWAGDEGAARVIVAHADLPLVESLARLAGPGPRAVAILVPCHRDDGTPLLSVPVDAPFRFAYGPGSFRRHAAEARRLGLEVVELRDDERLRRDVDSVDDLEALPHLLALDGLER